MQATLELTCADVGQGVRRDARARRAARARSAPTARTPRPPSSRPRARSACWSPVPRAYRALIASVTAPRHRPAGRARPARPAVRHPRSSPALQPGWPVHLLDGVGHVPQIEAPGAHRRACSLPVPRLPARPPARPTQAARVRDDRLPGRCLVTTLSPVLDRWSATGRCRSSTCRTRSRSGGCWSCPSSPCCSCSTALSAATRLLAAGPVRRRLPHRRRRRPAGPQPRPGAPTSGSWPTRSRTRRWSAPPWSGCRLLGIMPWWATAVVLGREIAVTVMRSALARHGDDPGQPRRQAQGLYAEHRGHALPAAADRARRLRAPARAARRGRRHGRSPASTTPGRAPACTAPRATRPPTTRAHTSESAPPPDAQAGAQQVRSGTRALPGPRPLLRRPALDTGAAADADGLHAVGHAAGRGLHVGPHQPRERAQPRAVQATDRRRSRSGRGTSRAPRPRAVVRGPRRARRRWPRRTPCRVASPRGASPGAAADTPRGTIAAMAATSRRPTPPRSTRSCGRRTSWRRTTCATLAAEGAAHLGAERDGHLAGRLRAVARWCRCTARRASAPASRCRSTARSRGGRSARSTPVETEGEGAAPAVGAAAGRRGAARRAGARGPGDASPWPTTLHRGLRAAGPPASPSCSSATAPTPTTTSGSGGSRPMALPAEMQHALLPPLTFGTPRIVISGLVAPAYEVGGDAFDYAVNGNIAHVAVFDAVGHGLQASLLADAGGRPATATPAAPAWTSPDAAARHRRGAARRDVRRRALRHRAARPARHRHRAASAGSTRATPRRCCCAARRW